MLYVDSRPANIFAKPQAAPARFYQHSQSVAVAAPVAARLAGMLEAESDDTGTQTMFTVPGRPDYVMTLDGDDTFELRTRVGEDAELSVWEHTVREQLPMKRGLRARIGQRIPRIRPALMTYDDGRSLGEAFVKRRLRAVASTVRRRVFRGEGVQ